MRILYPRYNVEIKMELCQNVSYFNSGSGKKLSNMKSEELMWSLNAEYLNLFGISEGILTGFLEAVHWFTCRGFWFPLVQDVPGLIERKLEVSQWLVKPKRKGKLSCNLLPTDDNSQEQLHKYCELEKPCHAHYGLSPVAVV